VMLFIVAEVPISVWKIVDLHLEVLLPQGTYRLKAITFGSELVVYMVELTVDASNLNSALS
jgi:hypothetical protein